MQFTVGVGGTADVGGQADQHQGEGGAAHEQHQERGRKTLLIRLQGRSARDEAGSQDHQEQGAPNPDEWTQRPGLQTEHGIQREGPPGEGQGRHQQRHRDQEQKARLGQVCLILARGARTSPEEQSGSGDEQDQLERVRAPESPAQVVLGCSPVRQDRGG